MKNTIKIKYVYEVLKCIQRDVYALQKGNAQPHVYIDDLKQLKIPLPPSDVQQKIVDEIEKVEIVLTKIKQDITQNNQQIRSLLRNLYTHAKARIKLGDTDVFALNIG